MKRLVEVAEEEGIIEPEQADLIEQVVEFSDKRVREVMTPRPDVVAMQADASLEEMHAKYVETKFAKMPVYERSLDDIIGVVHAQDLLQIADTDLPKRKVRELMQADPVCAGDQSRLGFLREMRQKGQSMVVVIDEHGSVAGIATVEDLVEEIVGRKRQEECSRRRMRCARRMAAWCCAAACRFRTWRDYWDCSLAKHSDETVTTMAGLLSHALGKVPAPGDKIDLAGYRFEVLESNQRKVLRLRARRLATASSPGRR